MRAVLPCDWPTAPLAHQARLQPWRRSAWLQAPPRRARSVRLEACCQSSSSSSHPPRSRVRRARRCNAANACCLAGGLRRCHPLHSVTLGLLFLWHHLLQPADGLRRHLQRHHTVRSTAPAVCHQRRAAARVEACFRAGGRHRVGDTCAAHTCRNPVVPLLTFRAPLFAGTLWPTA